MANEHEGISAHSAEHFGDARDHWWNLDFLRLVAKRLRFDVVRDVLDVGSGVGHWGQLLASVLPNSAHVTGIEREAVWIGRATARARDRGLADRFAYQQGDATALPFMDATFDLVTSQTVLIHLRDPAKAIAEMVRVVRPGGTVLVAEPNNLSESLLLDSVTSQAPADEILGMVRLQLLCERGKVVLGEGDNSLGDRVPGMLAGANLKQIQVFTNDKATALIPPYLASDQIAFIEDLRDQVARGAWNWPAPEARRLFLAGGGDATEFEALYETALAARQRILRGVDDGSYHGIVGGAFYLIAGRRPES